MTQSVKVPWRAGCGAPIASGLALAARGRTAFLAWCVGPAGTAPLEVFGMHDEATIDQMRNASVRQRGQRRTGRLDMPSRLAA
jgi:hypothetical protein